MISMRQDILPKIKEQLQSTKYDKDTDDSKDLFDFIDNINIQ